MNSSKPPDCPDCRRPMEIGYMVDHTYGAVLPASWAPGMPRKAWWGGYVVRKKDQIPAATFRCARCGRLQSYAWPT